MTVRPRRPLATQWIDRRSSPTATRLNERPSNGSKVRTPAAPTAESPPARMAEQFYQLTHPLRRRILVALAHPNPIEGEEFESDDFAAPDEDIDQLRTTLYHGHFPKLDDSGFIDWDQETNTVTRGPRFDEIEPLISLVDDHQDELPDGWP